MSVRPGVDMALVPGEGGVERDLGVVASWWMKEGEYGLFEGVCLDSE